MSSRQLVRLILVLLLGAALSACAAPTRMLSRVEFIGANAQCSTQAEVLIYGIPTMLSIEPSCTTEGSATVCQVEACVSVFGLSKCDILLEN